MYNPIPIKRSSKYGANYWESYSVKMKRKVSFFGNLQYENWIFVEMNPAIKAFCERPANDSGDKDFDGKTINFDMWLMYDGREEFVDLKYDTQKEDKYADFKIEWCRRKALNYRIINEHEIRRNYTYLNNLKHAVSLLNVNRLPDRALMNNLENEILRHKRIRISELLRMFHSARIFEINQGIAWLLYEGRISGNFITDIFGLDSEVWKYGETKTL